MPYYRPTTTSLGDGLLRKSDPTQTFEQRLAEIRKLEASKPSRPMNFFDDDTATARQLGEMDEFRTRIDTPVEELCR